VHRILLAAPRPVVVVESLTNLARLPSRVILVVLPLKFVGLDGSPARAIALI
jgi:kynurenine formamidase